MSLKKRLLETEDGTYTVTHPEFNEAMHSIAGAYDEALKKYVYPSQILEEHEETIRILDIGFGLGYNVLASIHELLKKDENQKIEIVSLEKDRFFTDVMKQIVFNDSRDLIYQTLITAYEKGFFQEDSYSVTILFGDARKKLQNLQNYLFNVVYQDPFSPAKNPELWTVEYFKEIKRLMLPNGRLTTYSSAPQVRRGLLEANLIVATAPSTGKKREGTIASPGKIFSSDTIIDREKLFEEPRSEPYHDENFSYTREKILNERTKRIKIFRDRLRAQS